MKFKGSFVNEYICASVCPHSLRAFCDGVRACAGVCAVRITSSGSRSAKDNGKGSTWVMTWNTASWLSDRMTPSFTLLSVPHLSFSIRLSFLLCLSPSACLSLSLFLSSNLLLRVIWFVKKPAGDYPCKSQWRDLLQPSVNGSAVPRMTVGNWSLFWEKSGSTVTGLCFVRSFVQEHSLRRSGAVWSHGPLTVPHGVMCS